MSYNIPKLQNELIAAGITADIGMDNGTLRLDFLPMGDRETHPNGWKYIGSPSAEDLATCANVIASHDDTEVSAQVLFETGGKAGIGEESPSTLLELTDAEPYLTLHNSKRENDEGGRESRLIARGKQSDGDGSVLGYLEFAHSGKRKDERGKVEIKLNDGRDGDAPSFSALKILPTGEATINGKNVCVSEGETGGSGSAGSGNQHVLLTVGDVTFKVLHDGII